MISVRVPATSANLGAGFDVLGMALSLTADVGCGTPVDGAVPADDHHPAAVAFGRLGGVGALWTRSPIPMGRGLGYSGAMRVGGAACAVLQRGGDLDAAARHEIVAATAALEGHADNVAASVYGGVVVAIDTDAGPRVTPVRLGFDPGSAPAVVVWIPDAVTTSTDHSRTTLAATVDRVDAVFNIGRVATLVAGLAAGDVTAIAASAGDRLHQRARLARVPGAATAIEAAVAAGAWTSWLSGSGPTVAALCAAADADAVIDALPSGAHTKLLTIAVDGVTAR